MDGSNKSGDSSGKSRAIFLDRDGVLNHAVLREGRPFPPNGVSDLRLIAGVEESCRTLKANGLLLIVVTNQPDIARGKLTAGAVNAINDALLRQLPLDAIVVCPHDDHDGCACRKPKPGLLYEAATRFDVDLRKSVMVGDRWRDVAAGQAANCKTVFIDYGYDEARPHSPDYIAPSLAASLAFIISVTSR